MRLAVIKLAHTQICIFIDILICIFGLFTLLHRWVCGTLVRWGFVACNLHFNFQFGYLHWQSVLVRGLLLHPGTPLFAYLQFFSGFGHCLNRQRLGAPCLFARLTCLDDFKLSSAYVFSPPCALRDLIGFAKFKLL